MRNTEYQFVDTDTSTLETQMVATYEKLTGMSVAPASPERLFIKFVSNIILQERALLNYVGNQNIPSRAEGVNLDALGELLGMEARPSATAATCTVRFHISRDQQRLILIPAGTRVTDANSALYWATQKDLFIPIGDTYIDTTVVCQTIGSIGNGYEAGQINTIVDVYDYYSACENITQSANGSDVLTDDEYYQLMKERQDAYTTAGPLGAYRYLARSVSNDIGDVVANSPEAGTVCIYAIMADGSVAPEETKRAILEKCSADDVRPLTDRVTAADPEAVSYNIDFTYYLSRNDTTYSAAEMANRVSIAVSDYAAWQNEKIGRDINPDKLRHLLLNAGCKRIDIREPVYTALRDGKPSVLGADSIPQVAVRGTTNAVSGGYEND